MNIKKHISKSLFWLIAVFFVIPKHTIGQFPNPLDFNTATNATNTGTLAIGSNDLHWTAALTNSVGPYIPAVVCGNQAVGFWVNSPFPNANWITYPHTCSAGPSEHSCLGNVDEFYKLIVNLPSTSCNQSVSTPSAYCLSFDFFADNWVSAVYVNNVLSFNNPNANPYGAMGFTLGGKLTVSLCNNWISGTNTVIVHVKSGAPSFPGWTGFLAQANQTVNTTVGIPVSASVAINNVSCFGGNNGSASVTASGGNGPFTYTWLPTGGNGSTATNLTAGNYSVIVSNAVGCTTTATLTMNQPPALVITVPPNTVICNGGSVNLIAGGANTYSWSNGATTAVTTITAAGIYTVTGTNTLTGCSNTNTVEVLTGNNPTVTITGTTQVCAGKAATLTASGGNTYLWSNNASSSSIIVSPTTTSIYTVTGTDIGGICFDTETFTVSIIPSPSLIISGNTSICETNSTVLTASGAHTYSWSTGSTIDNITVSPPSNTTFQVIGTNTLTGCSSATLVNVFVGSYPIISVADASVCMGQEVTITANGANSYTWNTGSNANAISISPLSNSVFTVVGSGSIPFCTSTQTVLVTVLFAPQLTVTANPSTPVCKGKPVTLSVIGGSFYFWSNGKTGNSIEVNPSANSIYTVTSTNTVNTCQSTKTIQINVNELPNTRITADTNACEGDLVILQAEGSGNYMWSNGAFTSSISVALVENEVYSVTGINMQTNCSNTASITLLGSNACCEFFIPRSFTPNNDGQNDEFGPKTLCKFKEYKMTIFDRWGEMIFACDSPTKFWDGVYKGKVCQDDIYVYLIEATYLGIVDGKKHLNKTGHVVLLK